MGLADVSIRAPRFPLREGLQRRFRLWVDRRLPAARRVVLSHRSIFILPTRQGLGFGLVLILMFVGAVNYQASLAFAVVFLLAGMFLLSILYTYRNLSGLSVSAVPGVSVFAGENAEITVVLERRGQRSYEALQLGFAGSQKVTTDLIGAREVRLNLYVPTARRGRFAPGRLTLESVFPFGLCRAWSLLDLAVSCLVYPRPEPCDLDWLLANQQHSGNTRLSAGNDDFHGLREYQRGDSLKRVAWKNFARGQGMFVKEYSQQMDSRIWLDWELFPGLEAEHRLSRLCYCVLQLDGANVDYGLRLPGVEIAPAKGPKHYERCLETLALYGLEGEKGTEVNRT